MRISSRRRAIAFFVVLGVCLVLLAVGLNVGWIILNWREGVLLFLGIIFFALLIAGLIVNTSFLVREIRRNEQHDSFINAVTHELKDAHRFHPALSANPAASRVSTRPSAPSSIVSCWTIPIA